jgi:hypothetical protein
MHFQLVSGFNGIDHFVQIIIQNGDIVANTAFIGKIEPATLLGLQTSLNRLVNHQSIGINPCKDV